MSIDTLGIKLYAVYPDKADKKLYLTKYTNRGSSDKFIEKISKFWDEWLDDLDSLELPFNKIKLDDTQTLVDVLPEMVD